MQAQKFCTKKSLFIAQLYDRGFYTLEGAENCSCPLVERKGHPVHSWTKGVFPFVKSLRLYGQAIKRTWWMPWQLEAMKDVVGYEKLRGAVKQALIRRCPNGETL